MVRLGRRNLPACLQRHMVIPRWWLRTTLLRKSHRARKGKGIGLGGAVDDSGHPDTRKIWRVDSCQRLRCVLQVGHLRLKQRYRLEGRRRRLTSHKRRRHHFSLAAEVHNRQPRHAQTWRLLDEASARQRW